MESKSKVFIYLMFANEYQPRKKLKETEIFGEKSMGESNIHLSTMNSKSKQWNNVNFDLKIFDDCLQYFSWHLYIYL
jgi:hypothetical protein